MLLSANNVLRSERNVQMKAVQDCSIQTGLPRGVINSILLIFLWNLFSAVPWENTNTCKTVLSGISQGAELMVWFSAGLAKPAHTTAVPAHGGVGTCGKGLLTAELLGVLALDQFRLHSVPIAAFSLV